MVEACEPRCRGRRPIDAKIVSDGKREPTQIFLIPTGQPGAFPAVAAAVRSQEPLPPFRPACGNRSSRSSSTDQAMRRSPGWPAGRRIPSASGPSWTTGAVFAMRWRVFMPASNEPMRAPIAVGRCWVLCSTTPRARGWPMTWATPTPAGLSVMPRKRRAQPPPAPPDGRRSDRRAGRTVLAPSMQAFASTGFTPLQPVRCRVCQGRRRSGASAPRPDHLRRVAGRWLQLALRHPHLSSKIALCSLPGRFPCVLPGSSCQRSKRRLPTRKSSVTSSCCAPA